MSSPSARTPRKINAYSRTTAELHKNPCTDAKPLPDKDYSRATTALVDTAQTAIKNSIYGLYGYRKKPTTFTTQGFERLLPLP